MAQHLTSLGYRPRPHKVPPHAAFSPRGQALPSGKAHGKLLGNGAGGRRYDAPGSATEGARSPQSTQHGLVETGFVVLILAIIGTVIASPLILPMLAQWLSEMSR